jgi:D-alanyl-lipoteichoic acid acyltransferase DltB (MBOAT superfamily)
MLFNSYTYLLLFLPLAVLGFQLLRRAPYRLGIGWLVLMSLVYYGWWNPDPSQPWRPWFLLLIVGSCFGNYFFGRFLAGRTQTAKVSGTASRSGEASAHPARLMPAAAAGGDGGEGGGSRSSRVMLGLGVAANLAVLGWFKYLGFFAATVQALAGGGFSAPDVILPLGLSFFTFQQIAYLVDAYRGEAGEYHIADYFLFVTFFPQLIAGPIVHHGEMMPQFARGRGGVGWQRHFPVALGFLAVGLFKKVVIADHMATIATPIFHLAAEGGRAPTMAEAWAGTLAYAMQIYFDFSGYSDMAIGSARLFGIRLPLNFHSPYKAASVIDFWRRWHITLSRFLRDYLYIPLGGNRKGLPRRYANLMVTMLLGGLWHGAGWTFVVWGGLHGLYLCVNNAWLWLRKERGLAPLPRPAAVGITFLAVLGAWTFFRAGSFEAAGRMLHAMAGLDGFGGWPNKAVRVVASAEPLKVIPVLVACWLLPNTQEIFRRYRPALIVERAADFPRFPNRWWQWRPTVPFALATAALLVVVGLNFDKVSEFIYFQF